eukprot:CAMPEP_0176293524 /NCGR_PEP_ID=MMETSP0121_2-20121125/56656_1 /TAXON_ID=160619 /ORGANISM="Kryptoperidinium foliaceum, Strain CCMP 1326" /LENGTH=45 /DNA_ID= /DNA_START= /DNA_END= /DNA_ORIENTATION=
MAAPELRPGLPYGPARRAAIDRARRRATASALRRMAGTSGRPSEA